MWGLSYAGINRAQVQRVFLSRQLTYKPQQSAPLAFTDVDAKLKDNPGECKLAWEQMGHKYFQKLLETIIKIYPKEIKISTGYFYKNVTETYLIY